MGGANLHRHSDEALVFGAWIWGSKTLIRPSVFLHQRAPLGRRPRPRGVRARAGGVRREGEPDARAEACLHPAHLYGWREAEPAARAGARCGGRFHVAGSRAEHRLVALGGRRCEREQFHFVLFFLKNGDRQVLYIYASACWEERVVVRRYRATLGASLVSGESGDLPRWHPDVQKIEWLQRHAISQRFD